MKYMHANPEFTASFTASFNQFTGSFVYIWYLTMVD
jgi:hypothetical protein